MRWIAAALLLFCAQALAAQSLADVARQQREDSNRPKATHVITNDDIGSMTPAAPATDPAAKPGSGTAKPAAKPATSTQQTDPERAQLQRHVTELSQRVQSLQNELSDLEKQRVYLRTSARYGDPNRIQTNEEINRLGEQIDRKNSELASARNELSEAVDRANKTSVIK
jgi:septal ring factor EnvC (AmiA/AmiB activator)